MLRSRRFTLADLVSVSRLPLAVAFVVTRGSTARLTLIGIAGLTDYVDGWLARRGPTGRYGAIIDPAADRFFILVVAATLVVDDTMTLTQCVVLMARDVVTTVGVLIVRILPAFRRTRLIARWSGKAVTALQFVTVVAIIIEPASLEWLLPLVAVVSAISVADYSVAVWRARALA